MKHIATMTLFSLLFTLVALPAKAAPDEETAIEVQEMLKEYAEDPEDADVREELGIALVKNGQYAEAKPHLQYAIDELRKDTDARFYRMLAEIGEAAPKLPLEPLMAFQPPGKNFLRDMVQEKGARIRLQPGKTNQEYIEELIDLYPAALRHQKKRQQGQDSSGKRGSALDL